jgi:hypothetical protein
VLSALAPSVKDVVLLCYAEMIPLRQLPHCQMIRSRNAISLMLINFVCAISGYVSCGQPPWSQTSVNPIAEEE